MAVDATNDSRDFTVDRSTLPVVLVISGVKSMRVAGRHRRRCRHRRRPAARAARAVDKCDQWTIPAQTYRAFGERLASTSAASRPQGPSFTLRILVGSYRRPFLASTGMLTEASIDKLLASRRDIAQQKLDWNPRAKSIVNVTVDGKPVTVRVIRPTAADVAGEVCGLR